jgi:thiol-disulfide isomerase/thioredoxin
MHKHFVEYSMLLLVAIMCGGCNGTTDVEASPSPQVAAPGQVSEKHLSQTAAAPAVAAASIPASAPAASGGLQPIDYAGFLEFIASHRGHPVVLDVWSTSCEPCVRELPNLAKLQQDYRERGVVCVSLNVDYTGAADTRPSDAREAAAPVLEALGIDVHNFYSTVPDRDLFKEELFKNHKLYAVPAILVFDQSGDVVASHGEAADESPYDKVRATVDSLF